MSLAGRLVRRARQVTGALVAHDRADDAGLTHVRTHPPHALEQLFGFDGLDDGFDGGAGQGTGAEGRAQRIQFHGGGRPCRTS